MPTLCFAHGGTYRGPADTTPPSGGGGVGGGGSPVSPGNPAGPGQPGGPPAPGARTPGDPGNPGGAPRSNTRTGDGAIDLAAWEIWWGFNKDAYLDLKSHILEMVLTGSEGYYLGRGEHASARDGMRVSEQTIRGSIVPSLLAALEHEKSDDIQSSCMIALAKIGDVVGEDGRSTMAAAIRGFLSSASQELSETAAVALGILADRSSLDVLTALLENDGKALRSLGVPQSGNVSVRTRAFAAYGLGLIGCKASLDDRLAINATLRKLLDGEGKTMAQRDVQVACLTSIGLSPLDPGESAAVDPASLVVPRRLTTRADQIRYLLAYSTDESNNSLIRAHGPTAMARLLAGSATANETQLKAIVAKRMMSSFARGSSDDAWMQQSCVQSLGMIGDGDADPIDKEIRAALMRVKEQVVDQQARNF
ncbi:MAG TPA: HEAT repeat domain-containing protein, partial [Planctomycetota bacterium]|nr:HEAT repeat domain-containing protein [Planctomycetota bacterium]